MRKKISRIFFATILSFPLFASVDQCPNIEEIKAMQIDARDMIEVREPRQYTDINGFPYLEPGEWQTKTYISNFGSDNEWEWSIYSIKAFSNGQALEIARQKLSSLKITRGPFSGQLFYSYCSYEDPVLFDSIVAFTKK